MCAAGLGHRPARGNGAGGGRLRATVRARGCDGAGLPGLCCSCAAAPCGLTWRLGRWGGLEGRAHRTEK